MTRHYMALCSLLQCGLALGTAIILDVRAAQAESTPTGEERIKK